MLINPAGEEREVLVKGGAGDVRRRSGGELEPKAHLEIEIETPHGD